MTDYVSEQKGYKSVSKDLGKSKASFSFAIVVEYISSPRKLTGNVRDKLKRLLDNTDALNDFPRGTIIGLPISENAAESDKVKILFPFDSHTSSPIKKGEHVWYITDEFGQNYWIGKKVSVGSIEDVNKTFELRKKAPSKTTSKEATKKKFDGTTEEDIGADQTAPPVSLNPSKDLKEIMSLESVAVHIDEPVPRYSTECGDYSIQGSNNTLIELGKDLSSGRKSELGAINIVAGRGMTPDTAPKTVVKNKLGNDEVDKKSGDNPKEGHFDFINDSSRIFITMNSDIDDVFGVSITNLDESTINTSYSKASGSEEKILPAIVSKSTNQLMIGRAEGTVRIVHESGSSIVMDENGNIQIQCGAEGQIRIGAVDASKEPAVLGDKLKTILNDILTQIQAITVPTAVGPSGPPLNVASFAEIQGKLAEIQSKITKLE